MLGEVWPLFFQEYKLVLGCASLAINGNRMLQSGQPESWVDAAVAYLVERGLGMA